MNEVPTPEEQLKDVTQQGPDSAPVAAPSEPVNISNKPVNIPSVRSLRRKVILGVLLIAVILMGWMVYAYTVTPRLAPARYFERVSESGSFRHNGQISVESNQSSTSQDAEINFSGSYKVGDDNLPEYQIKLDGRMDGGEFGGSLLTTENITYVRLEKPSILETFIPGVIDQWFKLDQNVCSVPDLERIQTVLKEDIYKKMPLQDQKRLDLFPRSIEGQRVVRYTGSVNMEELKEVLLSASSKLETVCGQSPNPDSERAIEDFTEQNQITYELASGRDYNNLKVEITSQDADKPDTVLHLETQDYGQTVNIDPPAGAVSLEEFTSKIVSERQQQQLQPNQQGLIPGQDLLNTLLRSPQ